jgi:hypothetical protein
MSVFKRSKGGIRESMTDKSHHVEKPGSAEYVLSLLTEPDQSCPHMPKLVPGRASKIPFRLGFIFHKTFDEKDPTRWYTPFGGSNLNSQFNPVLNLDTSKLCSDCYDKALPEGFDTWSMPYNLSELGPARGETTRYGFLPQQYIPGPSGLELWQQRETGHLKPFHNEVALPATFAYMQHRGRPFYLDVFHLSTPWKKEDDEAKDEEQLKRINMENGLAYESAARILVPDGNGGYGPHTTAEQRIGQDGTHRLDIVPSRWDEVTRGTAGTEKWSYIATLSAEQYLYPRPSEGDDFNLQAIPLNEALNNQIQQQPHLAQSYLSNADRVMEDYYSMNPENTRWPTQQPSRDPMTTQNVNDVEVAMRGRFTKPGEWEEIKMKNEEIARQQWERRGEPSDDDTISGDTRSRTEKIRALYKRRGVPEHLLPELPPPGLYE